LRSDAPARVPRRCPGGLWWTGHAAVNRRWCMHWLERSYLGAFPSLLTPSALFTAQCPAASHQSGCLAVGGKATRPSGDARHDQPHHRCVSGRQCTRGFALKPAQSLTGIVIPPQCYSVASAKRPVYAIRRPTVAVPVDFFSRRFLVASVRGTPRRRCTRRGFSNLFASSRKPLDADHDPTQRIEPTGHADDCKSD
jgi:hypothetical protein